MGTSVGRYTVFNAFVSVKLGIISKHFIITIIKTELCRANLIQVCKVMNMVKLAKIMVMCKMKEMFRSVYVCLRDLKVFLRYVIIKYKLYYLNTKEIINQLKNFSVFSMRKKGLKILYLQTI